jgi:hypothetical protein
MWLDFLSSFTQAFLNAVLPVLAAALAGLVIAWITEKINNIKSRLSEDARWAIDQAVRAAVLAAEQVHLVDTAIDKKDYALTAATNWLEAKGIKFDLLQLDTLIEAAVMEEFNIGRKTTSATFAPEPE